ncbi:MAG: DUF1800 family protein, partial [Alphaproteobacteria bacterium]
FTIHTAVIDETIAKAPDHTKFTTPENWLYQAHRTTGLRVPTNKPWSRTGWINAICDELGQSYNECPQPNGWSDLEADWVSKELLHRRVRYAAQISRGARNEDLSAHLVDVATRISGPDSNLVSAMQQTETVGDKVPLLLVSPQFLRI